MSNINFSYKWDKPTYLKAAKIAYDYEFKNSKKRYIGFFFIALTQFGVVAMFKKGAPGLLLISTFLVLYWYFLRWKLREATIKKAFDKLPNANMQYSVVADDSGITINSQLIKWDDVIKVVSLSDGVLIYTKDNFFFFPANAFKSLEDKNSFSKLAKANTLNYIKA